MTCQTFSILTYEKHYKFPGSTSLLQPRLLRFFWFVFFFLVMELVILVYFIKNLKKNLHLFLPYLFTAVTVRFILVTAVRWMICAIEEFYCAVYSVCSNCKKGPLFPFPGFGRTAVSFNITLPDVGKHATTTDYLKL